MLLCHRRRNKPVMFCLFILKTVSASSSAVLCSSRQVHLLVASIMLDILVLVNIISNHHCQAIESGVQVLKSRWA
jgi:hypothetical protein